MNASSRNSDPVELAKFTALAQSWWDPKGPSRPLHELNPLRLQYIERTVSLKGKKALDVGCGGGILSEALARGGAEVLGIDLSQAVLDVAELHLQSTMDAPSAMNAQGAVHAQGSRVALRYRAVAAEDIARECPASFDLVTCMEMLEHVPDPASVMGALAALVKPGGHVIVSTLNRRPLAFVVAIVGAEYIARALPMGTHEYLRFIRPSELARWGRQAGLELDDLIGISYNPMTRAFCLSTNTDVNYLARFTRAAA